MNDMSIYNLHVAPEIVEQYAGHTVFTFDPSHSVYHNTPEEAMQYFYKQPDPSLLMYAPDLLVIFACKFAGQDDIQLGHQLNLPLLKGELMNIDPYLIYRPHGIEATWTADADIYPEFNELIIVD